MTYTVVDAESRLQRGDVGAHLHAQLRVEVRERLVHQEDARLADDRAAHRDALALAARELRRLALEVVGQAEQLGDLAHARSRSAFFTFAICSGKPMFAATVRYG